MRTLIEISDDLLELAAQLDALEGDVTQHQDLLDAYLCGVGERDVKLDSYAALIRAAEARVEIRKAEARRLYELARLDEAKAEFLKARLKHFFETHGLGTVHTRRFRLTLAKNGGALPLRYSVPVEDLPEALRTAVVEWKPNTDVIRNLLDAGETDIAEYVTYGERGSSIRIK